MLPQSWLGQPMRFDRLKRRDFVTLLAAAGALPLAARAQQSAMTVVGFVSSRSLDGSTRNAATYVKGLGETGYVEGQNLAVEYRWALGQYDRLPVMAAQPVGRPVAALVAAGGSCTRRGKDQRVPDLARLFAWPSRARSAMMGAVVGRVPPTYRNWVPTTREDQA